VDVFDLPICLGATGFRVPRRGLTCRSASLIGKIILGNCQRAFYISGKPLLFNNPDIAACGPGDWVTSGSGSFRTSRDIRLESGMLSKADVRDAFEFMP
jgi:hypothetical protein